MNLRGIPFVLYGFGFISTADLSEVCLIYERNTRLWNRFHECGVTFPEKTFQHETLIVYTNLN